MIDVLQQYVYTSGKIKQKPVALSFLHKKLGLQSAISCTCKYNFISTLLPSAETLSITRSN